MSGERIRGIAAMPKAKLPQQTGNSCAAHCMVIAVAELLNVNYCLSKVYAEEVWWPQIKFKGGEGPLSDHLRDSNNSDPRRMVTDANIRWGGLAATIICSETDKAVALKYVDKSMQSALVGMFNMIKDFDAKLVTNSVSNIALQEGIYYNASFLMLKGSKAEGAKYEGMHNILVTKENNFVCFYNPNESIPNWKKCNDWKILDNQNDSYYSYVFTGVCIEIKRK